jgi:hypothetical protein
MSEKYVLCDGNCKVAKEVGPKVHQQLELAVLVGIGAAEAFTRGRDGKSMDGFQRAARTIALGLFREIGCLAVYADQHGQRLAEFHMLERMLGTDEHEPQS